MAAAAKAAEPVEQWGLFEIELSGPSEGNPFLDVEVSAVFSQDDGHSVVVPGFYDGDGVYRVRFMPEMPGEWHYVTRSNKPAMSDREGSVIVGPPGPNDHGPVRVRNTYHFAYADGTPFRPLGTTAYTWTHRTAELEEQTLHTLAGSPFNKIRMAVLPQDFGIEFMPPTRFPFEGTPPRNWDFTRFDPEFFRHLELRVGQLRDIGVEADLILFHPYGKTWNFHALDAETDDRYVRYVVARLAAYRNVWWSLANEYDFIRTKNAADWDRLFRVVRDADPFDHLRSIHNGNRIYNQTLPWVTHVSMQNGPAVVEPGRAELLRGVYEKPVIIDEARYEGNFMRWADLSGEEMVHRFWAGTVAGIYVGHGEFFIDPHQVTWLGVGGTLKGESLPRLAFLRQILEDSPAEGIDPIDRWEYANIGGRPGEYYLIYFGHEAPTKWTFQLPYYQLTDGMQFKVEILDTWNMTVTPVDGVFVTKMRPPYDFKPGSRDERVADERDGRTVVLPGRRGIALRIRRVGGPEPVPPTDPPIEP
jgi:Domain of unknown function (DUF5060)/Domain of unknown function (DUF5605)/Protein of unknown function (DUF4038)